MNPPEAATRSFKEQVAALRLPRDGMDRPSDLPENCASIPKCFIGDSRSVIKIGLDLANTAFQVHGVYA